MTKIEKEMWKDFAKETFSVMAAMSPMTAMDSAKEDTLESLLKLAQLNTMFVKYIMFDLEATRRENKQLIELLNKNGYQDNA